MKIAIITSFRNMPDTYSLVNDVRDQIKTLKEYGHEVVFFAQEGCEGKGIDCKMRAVIPHFIIEKGVVNQEIKEKMKDVFEIELKDFDVAVTHDVMYVSHYVTYRDAIKEADLDIKWIHWAHSRMSGKLDLDMSRARYVYMNYKDAEAFAKAIGVPENKVRIVYNDKDPRLFFDWHFLTNRIAEDYDLFGCDIMQTYPFCSTRMDAKGIDHVIRLFGCLKEIGNKVMLVFVNSNANKDREVKKIKEKMKMAKEWGLTDKDIVFTSTIDRIYASGVPRRVVRDLMQISNLFIFPSRSEVCSNVLLEASMTKQLVVLNKDFPPLFDFGEEGKTCLGYHFGSIYEPAYKFESKQRYMEMAKRINSFLVNNRINQQFQKIKKSCNTGAIYKKQLEPILFEEY